MEENASEGTHSNKNSLSISNEESDWTFGIDIRFALFIHTEDVQD